jgi:hypothetical protein
MKKEIKKTAKKAAVRVRDLAPKKNVKGGAMDAYLYFASSQGQTQGTNHSVA